MSISDIHAKHTTPNSLRGRIMREIGYGALCRIVRGGILCASCRSLRPVNSNLSILDDKFLMIPYFCLDNAHVGASRNNASHRQTRSP